MKKNKIFAMMAVAMTFAACSTSDITSDYSFDDDKNTVTVSSVTRAGENQTTTTPTTVDMHEPFLLTNLTQKDKAEYNYEAVFEYDSNNNSWEPSEKVMWYGSGLNEFQAFTPIPYGYNEASYTTFKIPDQDSESREAVADWMTATTTAKRSDNAGKLDLHFKHLLTKVTVKVTEGILDGQTFTVSQDHTSLFKSLFKYCQAEYNDNGVTLSRYPNDSDGDRWVKSKWTDEGNSVKSMSAIIVPGDYSQTFDKDTVCRFNISYSDQNSEELAVEFKPTNENPKRILKAGKHYTYNVTFKGHNQATISSVSVEPWIAENEITTTPAEKIPYVTFTSNEEVEFKMRTEEYTISGLEYSVNNGKWKTIPSNGISEGVSFGGSKGNLRLRGKNLYGTADDHFSSTISFSSNDTNAEVACTGDIRTLLDYENYNTVDTNDALFCSLFENCTLLTSAPELPATTLADGCYQDMFNGCTSLTTAPELPATTLADNCYFSMFEGCTSLTTAPELPATTLEESCYTYMFKGCKSLTTAPELKATTLAWQCYCRMFEGCILLETAPELKATTLANSCYSNMFNGCTSLTTVPKLKATRLADNCYSSMFDGCTSLTTAPELPATTLADYCYQNMFAGCTNLKSVTMLATNVSARDCLSGWLTDAGTSATSRKLKVNSEEEYNEILSNLPSDYWQIGKATILDKDGNNITSSTNQ